MAKKDTNTITMRGTEFTGYDLRVTKEGAASVKLHGVTEITAKILEDLAIDELPEAYSSGGIILELPAGDMSYKPNGTGVDKYAWDMPFQKVDGFAVSVVKGKTKKGSEAEREQKLSFTVTTMYDGAEGKLSKFLRNLGRHKGAFKLQYEIPEDPQLEIGDVQATEEQRQAALSEA